MPFERLSSANIYKTRGAVIVESPLGREIEVDNGMVCLPNGQPLDRALPENNWSLSSILGAKFSFQVNRTLSDQKPSHIQTDIKVYSIKLIGPSFNVKT